MKNLKNTTAFLLLMCSVALQANWPAGTSPLNNEKINLLRQFRNTNSIFVKHEKKQVLDSRGFGFSSTTYINSEFVTGHARKTEGSIVRILNWDSKVKFKLNRNMNIIFSYN